jgi:hypothetical protein
VNPGGGDNRLILGGDEQSKDEVRPEPKGALTRKARTMERRPPLGMRQLTAGFANANRYGKYYKILLDFLKLLL